MQLLNCVVHSARPSKKFNNKSGFESPTGSQGIRHLPGGSSWHFGAGESCSRFWTIYGTFSAMLLRWFEHSRVYRPTRGLDATGAELGKPFEDVFFKAADGVELNGWFYPAEEKSPGSEMAFLNCHGNGGNISDRLGLY